MQRRPHTVMEAVAALILLALIVSAIATSLQAAGTARTHVSQSARSLLVLENVVARLPGRTSWSRAQVEQLLQDEFAAVSIPKSSDLTPSVASVPAGLRLRINNQHGHPVARIDLPTRRGDTQ